MNEINEKTYYDLTYPQMSIVTTEQYFGNPHISTISGYVVIKDGVDFELLKEAIKIFINNHDVFKIRFVEINNEIKQYFDEEDKPDIDYIEPDSLEDLTNSLNAVVFKLYASKLYYATTFKTKDDKKGYAFTLHHAITDAWSETIIITQVNQIYDALLHGKIADDFPKTSYLEIIDSENHYLFSDKFMKDKEYWDAQFSEEIDIPEVREGKKFDVTAKRIIHQIPKKYFDYCTEHKISPFSFFLAGIFIYFSRIYNSQKFIIGTPVLNRTNFKEKSIFGMFISTHAFKQFVDDELSLSSLLDNITSSQFSLLRHQKYPLELIQKAYREKFGRKQNLYDILYSYQNARVDTREELSFEYESTWVFSGVQADALDISIFDIDNTGNLQIGYDYLTGLYSEEDINQIHNRLFYIFDQIINDASKKIKDIEIVTDKEKEVLLNDFNNTYKKYDEKLTISKLFEEIANKYPNNIALIFDDKTLSYKELNEKANYLATILRNNGIKNNDIVGIMTYRSFEMIIAQLAILKCGGAYLPIDPAYPEDRISYILQDSKCPLLLTTSQIKTSALDIPTLNIDFDTLKNAPKNLDNINKPDDIAYVIYTSGSTGRPKGAMIRQYSIVNTLLWRKDFYNFDESFTTLQIPSFAFDSSVEDIFTSLISGSKLILLKQNNTNFSLPLISELIKKHAVNHMLIVPSFYNIILDELSGVLQNAKVFTVAGEGFSEELVKKHFELLPNVRLVNEYGPTENSVCSTFYEFDKDNTKIYIGKPITNCKCYVLNSNHKLQPYDVKGELYVSGPGLSLGYIGRDDLTSERFIENPFYKKASMQEDFIQSSYKKMYKTGDLAIQTKSGNLIFCERADFQVKYNGYRINLGEIESVLSKITSIPNVVVLLKKDINSSALVAYVETASTLDIPSIKKELNKLLPHYMIPRSIVAVEKFPTTPNNKIDRKAIANISADNVNSDFMMPRNNLDEKILDVWKKVLNLPQISIDSSIFDIGGDSLSIIAIQSMLYKINIHTKIQDLFEYPSIKELSDHLVNRTQDNISIDIKKAFPRLYIDKLDDIKKTTKLYAKNILLTGVTGYLGAHVLNDLMELKDVDKVFCIIRERPGKTTEDRLIETLDYYFDGKWKEEIGKKIIVLNGDLSRELFGLNPTTYRNLVVKTNAVINCASLVKHFGVYDLFYNSNVLSVQNLIDFAKEAGAIINHVSTTSVSGNYLVKNDIEYDYTENDFYIGQNYKDNVYVESKFEAESLLFKAQQDGVKSNIFRVGNIMPRFSDGKFQINKFDNAYYKRVYGFIKLGILPENLKTQFLEFTPVDYCSKAIVTLSRYENKVFHLLNDKVIYLPQLISVLNEFDKTIQFVSEEEFNNSIKSNSSNEILESFITDLDYKDNLDYSTKIIIKDDITKEYFKLENLEWPTITNEYLKNFISDMI